MCDCNCSLTSLISKEIVDFNSISKNDSSYAESSVFYTIEKLYKCSSQNYAYDFVAKNDDKFKYGLELLTNYLYQKPKIKDGEKHWE